MIYIVRVQVYSSHYWELPEIVGVFYDKEKADRCAADYTIGFNSVSVEEREIE